jgi:putative membrane protein
MKSKILLFLKGMLMGICDLIPGISGGTIAFITGIYERLINAVKGFSPRLLSDLLRFIFLGRNKKELKQDIKKLDLGFLVVLLFGIFTALLLGSRVISFLLTNYLTYTLAFFVGLILASSKIIFDNIKNHNICNMFFGIIGLATGVLFAFLIPGSINPTLSYVFIGGFVAISAMFLPGISGAFILLIMGLYEFMINVLHNILQNINYLVVFALGAILGAFTISRVISLLFKKDKSKTLYFLLGLVIGALSIPVKRILIALEITVTNIIIMIFFFLLSIFLVAIASYYKSFYERKLEKLESKI